MRLQRTAAGAARFSWQICNQFMLEWTDRRDDDDDGDDDDGDDENDENCSPARPCWQICHRFLPGCLFFEEEKRGCGGDEDQDGMMMRMIVTHLL